jgi:hypothetical protein
MLLALAVGLLMGTAPLPADTLAVVAAAVGHVVGEDSAAVRGAAGFVSRRVLLPDGESHIVPVSAELRARIGERLGMIMRPEAEVVQCTGGGLAARGIAPACTVDARSFWGITIESLDEELGRALVSVKVTRRGTGPDRLYSHALVLELERLDRTWSVGRVRMGTTP